MISQQADASGAHAAGLRAGTTFSAFAQTVLTRPVPVRGTDGLYHLAYELVLTNTTALSIAVEGVQALDASTHRVVLSLTGSRLRADMNLLGGPSADEARASESESFTVGSSQTATAWLDVRLRQRTDVPRVLEHRVIAETIPPPGGQAISATGVLAAIATSTRDPIVLGPPVGAGAWLASEGCCDFVSHHRRGILSVNGRLEVPQRFAIDWFLLDAEHRAWVGDPTRLSSYLSYGQPVIAAANGTVVDTQDGLPDNHPPQAPPVPPIHDTVGNHITIRVTSGLYLLYGHLEPGSVRVRPGQHVRRGQQLGLIGTSGNSSTPHLHFQVMTRPTFFPTDSPPYMFDHFDLVGQITKRIWDDDIGLQPTGTLPFAAAPGPITRTLEMPLERNVVQFR